jgi:hypothetical protein
LKKIQLENHDYDEKALIRRAALETDTKITYSENGVYELGGQPVLIYGKLELKHEAIAWAIKTLVYQTSTRTNGLKTNSRIFGYRPRNPLRADFCSTTSMALTHPKHHEVICEFGKLLNEIYTQYAPGAAAKHDELLSRVAPGWTIPGTRFTSGIVNANNQLKYHHDGGNFDGVMSCMFVLKSRCEGGHLSIPQFNAKWELHDQSFLLFDGQAILHGVTPMKMLNKNGYRYSVVYYALKEMENCLPPEEEIKRVRIQKMEKEKNRV